ncbi:MAG TPA: HAMP domain-containing sensor histidine kinase [Nocardioides sp.]|jgi:two-component system sensor histidine kinase MprB
MSLPPWDRSWHYRRSLASRVTLLTTMAVGVAVAFVALGAYVTARVQMQASLDQSLLDRAHAAARSDVLQILTSQQVNSAALGAGDIRIIFIDAAGNAKSVDRGPTLNLGTPELDVAHGDLDQAVRTIRADTIRYRVVTVPTDGGALVLAQSLGPQDSVLAKLGLVMLLFGGAGVIAAGLAGWAVARNGLRPVRRLTASVEKIALTEDLTPLAIEGDDEIARLAGAFNTLLVGISAARHRQRQLVADAGHELRTPLTSLRTNLDLLSQADSADVDRLPAEARTELLDDVRAQIEELTTLIGDLIELARDEPVTVIVEHLDLAEVVERALARVRLRAPSVEFVARLHRWVVEGESLALERAVTNLLDNAAKWSPPGGRVTVRLSDGVLSVADQGPGISEQDLPHIFDRFYRSTESRGMPGSGLGLSIVRQVAERHGGTTRAATGPEGGALFTIRLPGSPS